jgi:hypothetical protein
MNYHNTNMNEYKKVLNDKQWEDVYKELTINKWQAGFMLSGILLFALGVAWFVGQCVGYFVERLL